MFEIAQALSVILMFSTLIQFCVDLVKQIVGEKVMLKVKAPVWSLAFGVLFAFLFGLDFFAMLGLNSLMPYVAQLVTGLILSAGSAPIHELIAKLRQARINDEMFLMLDLPDGNTLLEQRTVGKTYEKTGEHSSSV